MYAVETLTPLVRQFREKKAPALFKQHRGIVDIYTKVRNRRRKYLGMNRYGQPSPAINLLTWLSGCHLLHKHRSNFNRFPASREVQIWTQNLLRIYFHQRQKRSLKTHRVVLTWKEICDAQVATKMALWSLRYQCSYPVPAILQWITWKTVRHPFHPLLRWFQPYVFLLNCPSIH